MTDSELRKKCGDIVGWVASMPNGLLGDEARFMLAVSTRLLELLPPADDVEAVTAEWLKAVGFEFTEDDKYVAEKEVGYDSHVVGVSTPNGIGWDVYDSFDDGNTVSIGELTTRGHVRRLCQALGVNLTEPK